MTTALPLRETSDIWSGKSLGRQEDVRRVACTSELQYAHFHSFFTKQPALTEEALNDFPEAMDEIIDDLLKESREHLPVLKQRLAEIYSPGGTDQIGYNPTRSSGHGKRE